MVKNQGSPLKGGPLKLFWTNPVSTCRWKSGDPQWVGSNGLRSHRQQVLQPTFPNSPGPSSTSGSMLVGGVGGEGHSHPTQSPLHTIPGMWRPED